MGHFQTSYKVVRPGFRVLFYIVLFFDFLAHICFCSVRFSYFCTALNYWLEGRLSDLFLC